MNVEIVVPDVHNNWNFYETLDTVIDENTDRVFMMGDLRDQIDTAKVEELLPDKAKQVYGELEQVKHKLQKKIKESGGIEQFQTALQNGSVDEDTALVVNKYQQLGQAIQGASAQAFAEESGLDYKVHEEHIKALKEKHGIDFYGVPGNHDTIFLRDYVKSVDWLVYDQKLGEEGIVGALICREDAGEMQEAFNGPGLSFAPLGPQGDDDYSDHTKSKLYKEWTGKNIDLLVSHSGGEYDDVHGPHQWASGKGATKLAEENGFVNYQGHIHGGVVYRDEKTNVLTIRPGMKHIAKVYRDGKDVSKIELYAIN